jgi:hypothetical protein
MMARLFFPFALLALASCAPAGPPMAHGPWRPLNQGKWAFNENALTQPPPGLAR